MRIWLVTVFGLALASALLTRLGDMYWSPGIWPRFGVGMTLSKIITSLIATGPVAVLLGLWAMRLTPLKERGVPACWCALLFRDFRRDSARRSLENPECTGVAKYRLCQPYLCTCPILLL
ncbi:MAG: hypothetical protein QM758_24220 [Armatimonas sp.]